MSRKGKSIVTKNRLVLDWRWGYEWEFSTKEHERSYGGDENVLKICLSIHQLIDIWAVSTFVYYE